MAASVVGVGVAAVVLVAVMVMGDGAPAVGCVTLMASGRRQLWLRWMRTLLRRRILSWIVPEVGGIPTQRVVASENEGSCQRSPFGLLSSHDR